LSQFISLLRGINVSGQKLIKMADLAALYESLDFKDVKTYIQSGNVIFHADSGDSAILSQKIKDAILTAFGFDVSVFIRTQDEWRQLAEKNPFLGESRIDSGALYVAFLSQSVTQEDVDWIDAPGPAGEEIRLAGTHAYLHYPNGVGRSKWNNNFLEKKLGVSATMRNWRTVLRIFEMCQKSKYDS